MAGSITKTCILLSGILLFSVTSLCYAQEPVKLFDVKIPQETVSPVLVPEAANSTGPRVIQEKPDKKVPETSWFWRFIGGTAIGAAKYNTERQSEGRPPVNTYKAWP